MIDLLSRLSSATGPSRELDAEVALANGWTLEASESIYQDRDPYWRSPTGQICPQPPRYTESVTDVLRDLMPEGLTWELSMWLTHDGFKVYYAEFHTRRECQGKAATPALALLIAIEKARVPAPPKEDKAT